MLLTSQLSSFGGADNWQPAAGDHFWSHGANWSAGVPVGSSDVQVSGTDARLDTNSTIGSLTIGQSGEVVVPVIANPPPNYNPGPYDLTVGGTTTLVGIQPAHTNLDIQYAGTFTLGTLANLSSNGVLTGNYSVYDHDGVGSNVSIIQFRNANVITNQGDVFIGGGPGAAIRDQVTVQNAFRNMSANSGEFHIEDGPALSTSTNLTNNGNLLVYGTGSAPGVGATNYKVNGTLENNSGGYVECYGPGAKIVVTGDLNNSGGDLNNGGVYVDNDSGVAEGEAFFEVEGNVHNSGAGAITVAGEANHPARLFVHGNITSDGSISLNGWGNLQVGGVLSITSGQLRLNTGSGSGSSVENFKMTAERIDLAAGTLFGARGTIFADLVDKGVFAPGSSPGQVVVNGSIAMEATAELQIELGGTTPATQYDQIVQQSTGTGGVTLGGSLNLAFVNGFESTVQSSDTFTILTSDLALSGAFANVANGSRLHVGNGSSSFVVSYSGNNVVLSGFKPEPLTLISAVSRKVHLDAGAFDVSLPLGTGLGVECRRGNPTGTHELVFTFSNQINSATATVTGGTAAIAGAPVISGNTVTVDLTSVPDAQVVTVKLTNVTDTLAHVLPETAIRVGFLRGDVNGDSTVNSGDAFLTRKRSGSSVNATNFRADVNTDGSINAGDAFIVRGASGHTVP